MSVSQYAKHVQASQGRSSLAIEASVVSSKIKLFPNLVVGLSSKEWRYWTSYSRGCEPKGGICSGGHPWEWIALPPPSPHFSQENNTSRIVYSNGHGPREREGVQRQLIASTATINKRVLWFSAELTNIMQTRDATHKCSFIHPACTPTKLTYYANSKNSN